MNSTSLSKSWYPAWFDPKSILCINVSENIWLLVQKPSDVHIVYFFTILNHGLSMPERSEIKVLKVSLVQNTGKPMYTFRPLEGGLGS